MEKNACKSEILIHPRYKEACSRTDIYVYDTNGRSHWRSHACVNGNAQPVWRRLANDGISDVFSDDSLHNNLFTNLSGPRLVVASLEKKSWLQEKDCRLPSGIRSYHPPVIKESQNFEVPGSIETNVWLACQYQKGQDPLTYLLQVCVHHHDQKPLFIHHRTGFFLKTLIDHIFTIYAMVQQHLLQYPKNT